MVTFNTAVEQLRRGAPRQPPDFPRLLGGRGVYAVLAVLAVLGWGGVAAGQAREPHRGTPARPVLASPAGYEWFLRGELLRAEGRYAEAATAFDMARGQVQPTGDGAWLRSAAGMLGLGGPEDTLLLCRLADTLDLAGYGPQAGEVLAEARSGGRDHPRVALAEARIAERHDDIAGALSAYRRAIALDPGQETAVLELAHLLERTGHAERARALLADARGGPRMALSRALASSDLGGARTAAIELLSLGLRADAALHDTAARLLTAGQRGPAYRLLAALPAHRRQPELWLRVTLAAGARDTAAAVLDSQPAEALGGAVVAAQALVDLGRPARALLLAELALASEPAAAQAIAVAARARLALGQTAAAAALAASVPTGSRYRGEALEVLQAALQQAGLPALAAETVVARTEPSTVNDPR